MRKIVVSMWITLDGFVAGPDGEVDWPVVDDEMYAYERGLVDGADTLLLGRTTYGDFAGYWPGVARDPSAGEDVRAYARRLDALQKVVVSGSLTTADWGPSVLLTSLDPRDIRNLTAGPGRDIVIYGSLGVVGALTAHGLIDEYHLLVHPLFLRAGRELFGDLKQTVPLELVSADTFRSGVVLLKYRPAPAGMSAIATGS